MRRPRFFNDAFIFPGLTPGKKYDIRVLAATKRGLSDLNLPWVTFEVPKILNTSTPLPPVVQLQAVNSTSINATWNITQGEFVLLGYKLYFRKQNGIQMGPVHVPVNKTQYLLVDLGNFFTFLYLTISEENQPNRFTSVRTVLLPSQVIHYFGTS